eukprot:13827238-Alexandrium_andersonii.AAC.1
MRPRRHRPRPQGDPCSVPVRFGRTGPPRRSQGREGIKACNEGRRWVCSGGRKCNTCMPPMDL